MLAYEFFLSASSQALTDRWLLGSPWVLVAYEENYIQFKNYTCAFFRACFTISGHKLLMAWHTFSYQQA
jgi:hypothetical protein